MLKRYAPGNLTTNSATIVSCGQNQRITVKSMWFANTHSGNVSLYVNHVPSGNVASTANSLVYNSDISSHSTVVFDTEFYMEPGDTIEAYASAASHIAMFVYAEVFEQ